MILALFFVVGKSVRRLNLRTISEKNEALEAAAINSPKGPMLRNDTLKTRVRFRAERDTGKPPSNTTTHCLALRANMLFLYLDEKDSSPLQVACLDGCTVTAVKRAAEKPRWHKRTALHVQHATNHIFLGHQSCWIYFPYPRDLECWYYALSHASVMSAKKTPAQEELRLRQMRLFERLSDRLASPGYPLPPAGVEWLNGIAGRVFWNVHDQAGFLGFLTRKLQEKINKIKKPQFVDAITVKALTFGAHLPQFSQVQLLDFEPSGSLSLDLNVDYRGAFQVTIEIVLRVPKTTMAMPVCFTATVSQVTGRGRLYFPPPPSDTFWLAFHSEPQCTVSVDIQIGSSYTLLNVPTLTSIVVERLKTKLIKVMVLPVMDDWPLPSRAEPSLAPTTVTQSAPSLVNPEVISADASTSPPSNSGLTNRKASASTEGN